MRAVTEPQVWTMIAVFTALMSGMLTVVSTLFVRVLRSEIEGLGTELRGEIHGLRTEVTGRIQALDRDVQALMRHTFGIDRG
jgi:hypothetical protein